MNRYDGSVSLFFGDAEHVFRLGIVELRELQTLLGKGPHKIYDDLTSKTWMVDDVVQVLRVGLIGGGMEPGKARALVEIYVEKRPQWLENVMRAQSILMVGLVGPEEDEPGKRQAAADAGSQTVAEDGNSPPSTKQESTSA